MRLSIAVFTILFALPAAAERLRPMPRPSHLGVVRVVGPDGAAGEVRCGERYREVLVVPGEVESPHGSCVVTVRAPGFEPVVKTIDVRRGEVTEVHVQLAREPRVAPRRPMAERDVRDLSATLKRAPFAKERLKLLHAAMARSWVTTEQSIRLMGLFPFDVERLDAARILAPRLVDPDRAWRMADALTFAESKAELTRILKGEEPGLPVADQPTRPPARKDSWPEYPWHDDGAEEPRRDPPPPAYDLPARAQPPMRDGEFDDLLQAIEKASFSRDQLNLLRDAARRNRFRTEQVRRVVKLFAFGADQVDAAAILYPKTVDRRDFYKVLGDLSFESDREALRVRMDEVDRAGLDRGDR